MGTTHPASAASTTRRSCNATGMVELFKDETSTKAQRAMEAMLRMKKLDIAQLERA